MWGVLRRSSRATATLSRPLRDHVQAFEARGEDLTVAVRNEFIQTQRALVGYRVDKFWAELAAFRNGAGVSLATLSSKDAVCFARNVTRVLAVFLFAVMLGRNSIFPMLEPDSPFVEGLKWCNPNSVPKRYVGAVYGDRDEA
jgi:hypothetical protein